MKISWDEEMDATAALASEVLIYLSGTKTDVPPHRVIAALHMAPRRARSPIDSGFSMT